MRIRKVPTTLLATAALALGALAVPAVTAASHAAASTVTARAEAPDFASSAYGEPWEFAGLARLPYGSTVTNLSTGPDGLSFTAAQGRQLSLVRTENNAIPWGRDGRALPVDANTYTHLSARIYSSEATTAQLFWFSCPVMTGSCQGGMPLHLTSGWQDVDVAVSDAYASANMPAAWSGNILRLILTANGSNSTAASVTLAWLRLYAPSPTGSYRVQNVPAGASTVTWTREGAPADAAVTGSLPASGATAQFNADAFPPGTYEFSSGGTTFDTLRIDGRPLVQWGAPNAYGCTEYASDVRHDPWDMQQSSDVAKILNATNVSFSSSGLAATNAPPQQNDPEVWLHMGPALNSHRYYRVRFRISYDGPFGLADAPGGGMVARIFWGTAQYDTSTTWQASKPIVIYPNGWNDVLVDMSTPYNGSSDPAANESVRYTWTQAGQITFLRLDPNEDPGQRRWYVNDVQVFGDCTAAGSFPVRISDARAGHGDEQVSLYAEAGSAATGGTQGTPVGTFTIPAGGAGGLTADLSNLNPGTYRLYAVVTNGTASAGSYAPTPLDVTVGPPPPRSTVHACPAGQVPADGFTDVPASDPADGDIACVVWWQVAHGTSTTTYSPTGSVPRDEMAAFIARLILRSGGTLPQPQGDAFSDIAGDPFEADINSLAAAGIVKGDSSGRYLPHELVTRDAMAAYLTRAYDYRVQPAAPLSSSRTYFTDISGDTFAADINDVASVGIAGGYGDGTYRPANPVLRDQMASFLARELDLLVTGGYATPPGA